MTDQEPLSASLLLKRGPLGGVGLERIALLEAIGELGSITAASRRLGLSYKGAWNAVQALNNLFDAPLVAAAPGGKAGGTAEITPRGREVVAGFRRVEAELAALMARLDARSPGSAAGDAALLWSLGMRTSARNALAGSVASVTEGAVNSEVTLTLGEGLSITAIITRRGVDDLDLKPGATALALIKSSFVLLAVGEGLRTSARNQIPGKVAARDDGAVNSEITVDIGAGKTLTATITRESAEALGLGVGSPVVALIKAQHVILAVE
jgi:molybdate transport system regulatory protein